LVTETRYRYSAVGCSGRCVVSPEFLREDH